MLHFHGTPISPISVFDSLVGMAFCVSFARPDDVGRAHRIGQTVMLDNSAYSVWKRGHRPDWSAYYAWCDHWLAYPTTWAVIPDEIDAGEQLQDALIKEWPFKHRGAPVWHLDESVDRALRLSDEWPRVCWGSTSTYAVVGSDAWLGRIYTVMNELAKRHHHLPWVHMLRGMQCSEWGIPFASVDSSDVGQNHNRGGRTARERADRWNAQNGPRGWTQRPVQMELL